MEKTLTRTMHASLEDFDAEGIIPVPAASTAAPMADVIELLSVGEPRGGGWIVWNCDHPEEMRQELEALPYIGAFSYPGVDPEPRARGGYRAVVSCRECGHVRHENRSGGFVEATPWQRPARPSEMAGMGANR